MPSIAEVASQLIVDDLPAIFLDTCILLDVIRAIKRCEKSCLESALRLLSAATAEPRGCNVIVSYVVQHEWGDNQQRLLAEADHHLSQIQEQSSLFHDACAAFGIIPDFAPAHYDSLGLSVRMLDLSRQLLNCATVIASDDECSGRAMNRVMFKRPPSKRGGEAKDCTILEGYLAVCKYLQERNFGRKLVFCTSNKNDYCDESGLHASLAADFAAVGLRFTTNLQHGLYEVTA